MSLLSQVHAILRYPSCDKLTVVAMETIMSSHISFSLNPDTCEVKYRFLVPLSNLVMLKITTCCIDDSNFL